MTTRLTAIVVVFCLGLGCTRAVVKYPSDWAPVDSNLGCFAIAGTYEENGERAPGGIGGSFLRFTHLATYDEIHFSGPYVTLSFPERDVLLMKAGGERRFRFKEGEAACDYGKLQLRRWISGPTMAGPSREFETITLALSTDGWLIAEWDRKGYVLLAGFIPAYLRQVEWYRYKHVHQTTGGDK